MRRSLSLAALGLSLAVGTSAASPERAQAAAPMSCMLTAQNPTVTYPSPGHPCWVDQPYPFGFDGTPVDPSNGECGPQSAYGPGWQGDWIVPNGASNSGAGSCYMFITSFAFRAWNRGLAATPFNSESVYNPFGVWLFNGTRWYPDSTFPGTQTCPGTKVLWAGKADYWLVGGNSSAAQQVVCRYDGVNFEWEALKLPAATLARLPHDPYTLLPSGGVTAGACYSWDNCWFFGTSGIVIHWDGQSLTDASPGLGASPWLTGDFTAAVARVDAAGNPFGLAVSGSGNGNLSGSPDVPPAPDGSPPPQVFASLGGSWSPAAFVTPSAVPVVPAHPFNTNLLAVDLNSSGQGWIAGGPRPVDGASGTPPAPLLPVNADGVARPCPGYDPSTLTSANWGWDSLSVADDGSVTTAAGYRPPSGPAEIAVMTVRCDPPPGIPSTAITQFRRPDPYSPLANNPFPNGAPLVSTGGTTPAAIAMTAPNDGWLAVATNTVLRPHLYRWTDGRPPDAPAGDDSEPARGAVTATPPTFVPPPPAAPFVATQPPVSTAPSPITVSRLKAAIYAVTTKIARGCTSKQKRCTLYVIFKVRRAITVGVEALHRKAVVARSGEHKLKPGSATLKLEISPKRWPDGLSFYPTPK